MAPRREYNAWHRDQYLKSKKWRVRRAAWFKPHGGYCRGCGHKGRLDLHHYTYERLGHEWDRDLVSLCRMCHRDAHTRYDSGKYRTRWEATKAAIEHAKAHRPKRGILSWIMGW